MTDKPLSFPIEKRTFSVKKLNMNSILGSIQMVGQPVVILTSLPLLKALTSLCHKSTKTQMNTTMKRENQEKDSCRDLE